MKKKKNTMVLAAGALVCLGILYGGILWYKDTSARDARQRAEADKIYLIDADDITALSYDNGTEQLAFEKDGEQWYYAQDRDFPLQQFRVEDVVNEAKELTAVRKLEGGDEPAAYGLDKPAATVTVTDSAGEQTVILLGNMADDNYYACLEGDDMIYTVDSGLYDSIGNGLYDFIELESLPYVTGDRIQSFRVETEDGTLELTKQMTEVTEKADETEESETGNEPESIAEWYLAADGAEAEKLDSGGTPDVVTDAIASLYVSECVNYKADDETLALYGLDAPLATVQYTYSDDEGNGEYSFKVGNTDETGGSYYVLLEDSRAVNLISAQYLESIIGKTDQDFQ